MKTYQVLEGKDRMLSRVFLKSWCDEKWFNQSLIDQIDNCQRLPFAHHHVALMPDAHSGYGMPIGGVLATKGVVIPNAVGVDIGCGMASYKTNWKGKNLSHSQLVKIKKLIEKSIPTGMNRHKKPVDEKWMPHWNSNNMPVLDANWDAALQSLGTLGGGNHFIEIQVDKKTDNIYVMIHSGSRNLGKQICDNYNGVAKDLNGMFHSSVDPKIDLAFLPVDSISGNMYLNEMQYAVEFAKKNREHMIIKTLECMNSVLSGIQVDPSKIIDVAHNYARQENHFGSNVWVHRKGATSAKNGEIGIIPGSQGSSSFIVMGLGNKDSFMSCSHGAGRTMGRGEAKRTLDMQKELDKMKGILHTIQSEDELDESVGSYKDIQEVMQNQDDLVSILVELTPLACVKGKSIKKRKKK